MHDSAELKRYALSLGFDSVGVCDPGPPPHLDANAAWIGKGYHGSMSYLERHLPLKADPDRLLQGVRSVVAVTLNYNQPNPARKGEARIARYALGRDYHRVLSHKLKRLAAWIDPDQTKHRICVDSAPIMERDYAQLAGLGWFGKNTMLIDSHRGSWFFIGILLTKVEFERDLPTIGACGTCTKCVDACPTGAIVFEDDRWQIDARRCISYLTIEHEGPIDRDTAGWTFGCDICQEVCPFNEPRPHQPLRAQFTSERDLLNKRQWPSLAELAQIDPVRWDEISRGSAVRRTGLAGIRRNAALNLK